MYLLIFAPMFPEGLIYRALTGISFEDRLVSLNLMVASSRLFALNFDIPPPYSMSSWILVLPNMLFLYSSRTSFLCFSSFLVRLSSGSKRAFLSAHFFYMPWSLLISISWRLFFFLRISNYFFMRMISLFSSSSNLISSYLLCLAFLCLRFSLWWLACSSIKWSTLSLYLTSSSESSRLKSSAS
jgi:hypothetical protein